MSISLVEDDSKSATYWKIGGLIGWEGTGHADLDVAIEIPDDVLAGSEEKITQVEIEGLNVYIIGVEDLIIDRGNAYVHWGVN